MWTELDGDFMSICGNQGVDCFNLSFHSFDGTGCNECIHVTTFDVVECCSIFVKAECPYIVVRLRNFKF